jgi:hypothetical protein
VNVGAALWLTQAAAKGTRETGVHHWTRIVKLALGPRTPGER